MDDDKTEERVLTEAEEATLAEAKPETEAEALAALAAAGTEDRKPFDFFETCSNCHHEFQLQCHVSGMGKLRTVQSSDHCKHWEHK